MANLSNFQKRQEWANANQILAAMKHDQQVKLEEDIAEYGEGGEDSGIEAAIERSNDEWAHRAFGGDPWWAQ